VFFATGFETTAVTTAAAILAGLPPNFFVLSAHKYIPPVMEIVCEMPGSRIEGFIAAGHAATITGWGIFEPFVARHGVPVVDRRVRAAGHSRRAGPAGRADSRRPPHGGEHVPALRDARGNLVAQRQLWQVFAPAGGRWRGIAHVPNGNLRLRTPGRTVDARRQFAIDLARSGTRRPRALAAVRVLARSCRASRRRPMPAVRRRVSSRKRRRARAWSAPKEPAASGGI
jgi:hydrogenase expression/formation protein HypD